MSFCIVKLFDSLSANVIKSKEEETNYELVNWIYLSENWLDIGASFSTNKSFLLTQVIHVFSFFFTLYEQKQSKHDSSKVINIIKIYRKVKINIKVKEK